MSIDFREYPRPRGRAMIGTNLPVLKDLFAHIDASGLTMAEISKKSGVHSQTIQNWRRGRTGINLPNFQAVAGAIGLDVVLQQKEPKK